MFLGAKITLARAWKKTKVSLSEAKLKISWIMTQEKLVATLQNKVRRFKTIWEPWALYVKIPLCPGSLATWFGLPDWSTIRSPSSSLPPGSPYASTFTFFFSLSLSTIFFFRNVLLSLPFLLHSLKLLLSLQPIHVPLGFPWRVIIPPLVWFHWQYSSFSTLAVHIGSDYLGTPL